MSIFKALLTVILLFSQPGLSATEQVVAKQSPTLFGYITNSIGLLSGAYTLHSYRALHRRHPKDFNILKKIKAGLTIVQVVGNSLYLVGVDTTISETAGDAILLRDTAKLAIGSAYGMVHYLTNILFIDRLGLARLLTIYDLWAIYGYGKEIVWHFNTIELTLGKS